MFFIWTLGFRISIEKMLGWGMAHLNVEIKARCNDHEKIRGILKSRNADERATEEKQ